MPRLRDLALHAVCTHFDTVGSSPNAFAPLPAAVKKDMLDLLCTIRNHVVPDHLLLKLVDSSTVALNLSQFELVLPTTFAAVMCKSTSVKVCAHIVRCARARRG